MRILAVRIGRVGDTVMMTPALKAILRCYPHAQITILASPEGKRLLDDFHPSIEQIWTWNRHGLIKSYLNERRVAKKMCSSKFDKIFCFDESKRIARLLTKSTAELYWLQRVTEPKHCSRHYLDLVARSCDLQAEKFSNYLPVNNTDSEQIERELSTVGITPDDIVVMIHPTYSGFSRLGIRKRKARARKLWPANNYGILGKRLSTQKIAGRQLKLLIDLMPGERHFGQKIVRRSDNAITLLDPQPGLNRYKALIKRADILLTPDSGPMHIASAVGTRIVAFFSMKDPADCGPYMNPSLFTILRSDDPVHGISTINVDTVYNAIMAQLECAARKPERSLN